MNAPEKHRFARLDVLDRILDPHINEDFFIRFLGQPRNADAKLALLVLGAVACGVTAPRDWSDTLHDQLARRGEIAIDRYLDEQLQERGDE